MKEIAMMAGVSRGTVDRVLNNRGVVNESTANKIKAIAESLNYTPNIAAKGLSLQKKELRLGYIFLNDEDHPLFKAVRVGAEKKAKILAQYGVTVIFKYGGVSLSAQNQLEIINEMMLENIHGLAIVPFNDPLVADRLREISESGIPVVTVNTDLENSGRIMYVGSDYEKGGRTAGGLMRLMTDSCANIGILLGSKHVLCHTTRADAFTKSVTAHNSNVKIVATIENNDDDFESYDLTKELLTKHPEINALFITSYGILGACKAVEVLNRTKNFKIICFDAVPSTRNLIERNLVTASITQRPVDQGSIPLQVLFDYLALGNKSQPDIHFVPNGILIRENL